MKVPGWAVGAPEKAASHVLLRAGSHVQDFRLERHRTYRHSPRLLAAEEGVVGPQGVRWERAEEWASRAMGQYS